ncbi:MAG: hypothetical protein KGL39_40355 [Patescibacteria group bacterium]|nr:hypothetical protein [Patescibacteria group bacterium]
MSFRTVVCAWDAEAGALRVEPRFLRVAREQFRAGEEYPVTVNEKRSSKAHAFYFASVNAAWKNLRGETAEILSSPTHLRGWALIQAGYHHQHIVEAPDKDSAMRMAMFARALARNEGYVEIKVIKHDGKWYVRSREPESQSRASMDAERFKESSRAVLDILSGAIEVTRKSLEREGRTGDHQ